ncbi:MAG: hypothetical protein KC502_23750 [Myxococcales bacterium]|nr:hypothetical protein [Myxococcales bacterium]
MLDQLAGLGLRAVYERTFDGDTAGMVNQALAHRNSDVIVFGSSRACHHVASPQLSKALGQTVFNAAVDGQSVLYARALQSELLRRGTTAKTFVLQVDAKDLFTDGEARLAVVTPLAGDNPDVLAMLEHADPFIRVKLLSASYPFNSKVLSIFANSRRTPAPDQWEGLPARPGQTLVPLVADQREKLANSPINEAGLAALKAFIDSARKAQIEVFIFCGPKLRQGGPGVLERRARVIFAELSAGKGVTFMPLDESSHPAFADPERYRDRTHLHREGALQFTEALAKSMLASRPAK